MSDGLRYLGSSRVGGNGGNPVGSLASHYRHFVYTFFLKPTFRVTKTDFRPFPFRLIDNEGGHQDVRVGIYSVTILNDGRDLAQEPTAHIHIVSTGEPDVATAPLLWLSGHSSDFPTIVQTKRSKAELPDVPNILLEHFVTGNATITKMSRGVASHALAFYTIEGLPGGYLGADPTISAKFPFDLDFYISVACDNPNYIAKKPLDFRRTLRIEAWDKVKEVKPKWEPKWKPK